MFKKLRKIVIVGVALMGAVVAHGATTRYVELRSTLQPNTTGLNAIFVSSGTILTLNTSTLTVRGPLTATGLATLGSATVTGASILNTLNVSGVSTFTTIAGTITDQSTTTHNGGHTFSSATITAGTVTTLNSSTATIANTLTVATVTVNGQIGFSDGNIRSANTNFVVGSSTFDQTNSTATTSASSFVFSNISTTTALHKSTNVLAMWATGTWGNDTANDACDIGFFRDSTFISNTNGQQRIRNPAAAVLQQSAFAIHWTDAPGDTSSHTYRVGFRAGVGGTCTLNGVGSTDAPILILEIGK